MKTTLEIEPAFAMALRDAGLSDFDAFMNVAGGPPTSKHKHRETLPVEINVDGEQKTFFLKRVFKVPLKHTLWPKLRGKQGRSQPALEWQRCRDLTRAGLPVMRAVACGERCRFGLPSQAFLLVQAVPMPNTLENWLVPGFPRPAPISKPSRDRLLLEVGLLIGKIAEAGMSWPDISAKHIYAAPNGKPDQADKWEFALIDVERMERVAPTQTATVDGSLSARRRELLATLLRSLSPMPLRRDDLETLWAGASATDSRHLGHEGNNHLPEPEHPMPDTPAFNAEPLPRLPDDYEYLYRSVPLRKLGRMFVDRRIIPWLQRAGINGFDDVFRYEGGDRLDKPGLAPHKQRIRMVLTNDKGRKRTLYLKRFNRPPLMDQLRRIRECGLRSSSGWREMHFIKRLSQLGIPTPRGLAFGQWMKGILEDRSFGITGEIKGESLEKLSEGILAGTASVPTWVDRREIIRQLALIAARLHRHGLFHRDLYLCHVFLCRNADGGIVLRLIDLARMIERKKGANRRWQIKDLAALDYSAPTGLVTRADRLRFLYDYSGETPRDANRKTRLRDIIQSVNVRVRKMARHDANRVKRITMETPA